MVGRGEGEGKDGWLQHGGGVERADWQAVCGRRVDVGRVWAGRRRAGCEVKGR